MWTSISYSYKYLFILYYIYISRSSSYIMLSILFNILIYLCTLFISTFIYLSISVSSCLSFHLFIIYLHKFLSFISLHHLSLYNSLFSIPLLCLLSPLLEHISYHLSLKLSTYLSNYLSIYLCSLPPCLGCLFIWWATIEQINSLNYPQEQQFIVLSSSLCVRLKWSSGKPNKQYMRSSYITYVATHMHTYIYIHIYSHRCAGLYMSFAPVSQSANPKQNAQNVQLEFVQVCVAQCVCVCMECV